MGLITKEVEVGLSSRVITWYKDKGYSLPEKCHSQRKNIMVVDCNKNILVKVEDLSDGSDVLVDTQCDGCGVIMIGIKWQDYKRYVRENGEYYCQKCAQNGYKKWVSFYEWCYINLTSEEASAIISRWDYELNIDKSGNKLSPKDVSCSSSGLNGVGYWFKCLNHKNHKSEQKRISGFVAGQKGSVVCIQCDTNVLAVTHPHLVKYLVNKEDALKYSSGSGLSVSAICITCGFEKEIIITNLRRFGFGCPKCSSGTYPERFLFSVLEQLNTIDFITQLSKTTLEWCKDYKYDFYIPSVGIIETHGLQHYKEIKSSWNMVLSETQGNDKLKEQLAKENGIENYIILDCRKSDMEWIKKKILSSTLPTILNFKENDIDWLKCSEYAYSGDIKLVCNLWNSGIDNIETIKEILKISNSTIRRYLRKGSEMGWCVYGKRNNQIICLTTGDVFNSQKEASERYDIPATSISACCRNNSGQKSAGKLPDGTKLVWMYYDEYLEINK